MIRVNIVLTGETAQFIAKIKSHQRGSVLNVILASAINEDKTKQALLSIYTKDEIDALYDNNGTEQEPKIVALTKEPNKTKGEANVATTQIDMDNSNAGHSFRVQI